MTQRPRGHAKRLGALVHSSACVVIVVEADVVIVIDSVEDRVVVAVVDTVEVAVVVAGNKVHGTDPSRHVCGPINELQICVVGSLQAPTESSAHTDG